MAASDEELMQRAGRGDLAAFGELFDRHQPALYGFLCRFLGNAALAEDVTQEVFWRVWQYRTTFDGRSAFSAWMYVIARHAALDEIRKPHRRTACFSELDEGREERLDVDMEGRLRAADAYIQELSLRTQVRQALQALPPDQRLCLILREYQGLSHAEAAVVLGCSEGAARVMAHRARRALRSLLEPLLAREQQEQRESEGRCVG